jgi:uncharacterized protein YbbC (DUF1343 family)
MKFEIKASDEFLTPSSGLAIVGECLMNRTNLFHRLNNIKLPGLKCPEVKNFEIITSYIGLLCQGKSDFDLIESYRRDKFFTMALNIKKVPSSPTLR